MDKRLLAITAALFASITLSFGAGSPYLPNSGSNVTFRAQSAAAGLKSFAFVDAYGSNLFGLVAQFGPTTTNYYLLQFGDLTPSKQQSVNISDVIWQMTSSGFWAIEFSTLTNAFEFVNGPNAFVGDFQGGNQLPIFDQLGNLHAESLFFGFASNPGRIDVTPAGPLIVSATLTTFTNNIQLQATTNQIIFNNTNTTPVTPGTIIGWLSVKVNGDSSPFRIPLYR